MKLLIVDTEQHFVEKLATWLRTIGYEVHQADRGEQAKILWEEQHPDLVIVDPTLKDVDAIAMWNEMCKRHDALVVVLTEVQDVQDEIRCLESGADDYLHKPVFPAQLLAHIHALTRRTHTRLVDHPSSIITVGPIRVDLLSNEVSINGQVPHLSLTESKLLHLLIMHANSICTVNQIATYIWDSGNDKIVNLVKVYIRRLRKKIEPDPNIPRYILTVPGVGYILSVPSYPS